MGTPGVLGEQATRTPETIMVSTMQRLLVVPPLLVIGLACSGGPTDPSGSHRLSAVVPASTISLGADIPALFRNASDAGVVVGVLSCTSGLERREATGWVRLESFRACIDLAVNVGPGERYLFAPPSPDIVGRYRIIFEAYPMGGQGAVTVRSNTFEVR